MFCNFSSCKKLSAADIRCKYLVYFGLHIFNFLCHILFSREKQQTKNLLEQFRIWKLMKRRHYKIVVSERAKKEMADNDDAEF